MTEHRLTEDELREIERASSDVPVNDCCVFIPQPYRDILEDEVPKLCAEIRRAWAEVENYKGLWAASERLRCNADVLRSVTMNDERDQT